MLTRRASLYPVWQTYRSCEPEAQRGVDAVGMSCTRLGFVCTRLVCSFVTQSFQAEAAKLKGRVYGAGLLDLVKAFERVPHIAVVQIAQRRGYCMWTLRLSLAA